MPVRKGVWVAIFKAKPRPVIFLEASSREMNLIQADVSDVGVPATGQPASSSTAGSSVGSSTKAVTPDAKLLLIVFASVLASYLVALILSGWVWDKGALDGPAQLVADVNIFALVYVFAQVIERLLEPLSALWMPTADVAMSRDEAVANALTTGSTADAKVAAEKQAALNQLRADRAILFWGVACTLAFFASASIKIYFLQIIGFSAAPRWGEVLVTGLLIGSGTKPVHDIVQRIQKASSDAQDPSETSSSSS